jgi:hypothetical protein
LSLTEYVLSTEAHPLPLLQRRIHCDTTQPEVEHRKDGRYEDSNAGGDEAAAAASDAADDIVFKADPDSNSDGQSAESSSLA